MTETENTESGYDGKGLKGALWTLAGVAIGQLATRPGVLGGVFGGPGLPPPGTPGAPVSREVLDLTTENAALKANAHADAMNAAQMVVNATQAAQIACQQRQIDQLFSLTQLSIPNGNLNPGYGAAVVGPAAPVAVQNAAASSPDATAIANAVATAVASALKDAA